MRIENVYPPTGRGTLEEQVEEIREYLQIITRRYTTMADTSYNILEELYRALTEEREDYNNAAIKKLWDKIEENNAKNLNYSMSNTFLRKTDFGSYFENATVTINGTPIGITQLYEYTAGIGTIGDLTDAEVSSHSSILTGLLYYDEDPITHQPTIPRYGVAVGEVTTMTDGQGRKIVDLSNLLGTFTSNELAFWNNGTKVLSLNANDGLTTEGIIKASGGNIGDLAIASSSAFPNSGTGLIFEQSGSSADTLFLKDRLFLGGANSRFSVYALNDLIELDIAAALNGTVKAELEMDALNGGMLSGDWDMDVAITGNNNTTLMGILADFEQRITALGG